MCRGKRILAIVGTSCNIEISNGASSGTTHLSKGAGFYNRAELAQGFAMCKGNARNIKQKRKMRVIGGGIETPLQYLIRKSV